MKHIEKNILSAAKEGLHYVEIFIKTDRCNSICAENVASKLRDLDYECETEWIYDQRDGDSIRFLVEW